ITGILLILITCQCSSDQAFQNKQVFKGHWISTSYYLKFTIHVLEKENKTIECYIDFPGEEAWNIPVDMEVSDSMDVTFDIYNIRCKYKGAVNDSTELISGYFITSDGGEIPVDLMKTDNPPERTSLRPQEPVEPYPYKSEEIAFENTTDNITLKGTLTIPDLPGPHPGVVLISGSGPNDRDQLIFGHRVFLVLADYLTRQGIAVLRYDDRGVGRSDGNYDEATFENFTSDALAACIYLKSRSEIDPERTGLLGHSEGAAIAPLAASQSPEAGFIVLMSAPGYNFIESEDKGLISQWEISYRNNGVSEEAISFKLDLLVNMFLIAKEESDKDMARNKIRELLEKSEPSLLELSEDDRKKIELESIETYDIEWMLSTGFLNILKYDPQSVISGVHCPVLAVHGSKDSQIPVENLSAVEQALKNGGNEDYTIKNFEGLNHLFQTAETGQVSEYPQIEETIAPQVLVFISEWIKNNS
ncbi:MAG: alpha/beta fold hydrolase, partial [Bacteroidales bacterium]